MYEFDLGSLPEGYSPIYADNSLPYSILNQNTAVDIPAHGTGDSRISTFAGHIIPFERLVFNTRDSNNLINVIQNGRVQICNGYKIVITQSPTPVEIESVDTTVKKTAAGSTWSKIAGNVDITCSNGETEPFPRCIFKSAARSISAASVSRFVIPPNCHYIVTSTTADGIPVVTQVDNEVECIDSGNNPKLHIGITARGSTHKFPRIILIDPQTPVPVVDPNLVSPIDLTNPESDDPLFNFALGLSNSTDTTAAKAAASPISQTPITPVGKSVAMTNPRARNINSQQINNSNLQEIENSKLEITRKSEKDKDCESRKNFSSANICSKIGIFTITAVAASAVIYNVYFNQLDDTKLRPK